METSPTTRTTDTADDGAGAPSRRRGGFWRWLRLGVVLGMVAGLVWISRPARLWEALRDARYLFVLAAAPVTLLAVACDSLRLHLLMRPHGFSDGWLSVFRTSMVVGFLSMFLPGTIGGGAVAWYRLSKPQGLRAQAFSALSVNTLLKIVVVFCLAAAGAALDARSAEAHPSIVLLLLAGATVPVGCLALLLWTDLTGFAARVLNRFGPRLLPARFCDGGRKILESLCAYRRAPGVVAAALAASLARKLFEAVVPLLCLRAIGVEGFPYARLLWISCTMEAASMLPFSPSGFGLSQASFVGLMALFGVTAAQSLAADILGKIAWLASQLGGVAVLLRESLRRERPDG